MDTELTVLIIEDDPFKFIHISDSLTRINSNIIIQREITANDGLSCIHSAKQEGKNFNLIIIDNYLPRSSESLYDQEPCAKDIMREIRRLHVKSTTVQISSKIDSSAKCDYEIAYNPSVSLTMIFAKSLPQLFKTLNILFQGGFCSLFYYKI